MIDIKVLIELHTTKSQELRESIQDLYKYKQDHPDCDKNIIKTLYNKYLEKKQNFEEIDLQYKNKINQNGIYFYQR